MKLTATQRKRLDRLATYLEGLPKRYQHFDMDHWLEGANRASERTYARQNGGVASCGTVACAAGHGPAAGVFVPPRLIRSWGVEWCEYARWLAGGDWEASDWLFSYVWKPFDNHHHGAAARIRYLLHHGAPPPDDSWPSSRARKLYASFRVNASAIEARRAAAPKSDAVHESAVPKADAQ